MHIARYLVNILIVGFWLIMMALLAGREFIPRAISPLTIKFPEKLPYHKTWSVYNTKGNIGYFKTRLDSSLAGYSWNNNINLKLFFGGEEIPVTINGLAKFDKLRQLRNFSISGTIKDFSLALNGRVTQQKLILTSPASQKEHVLPWSEGRDILGNGLLPWFYKSNLKTGDRFYWEVFNPTIQKKELVAAAVKRSSIYYHKGDLINTKVVNVTYQGMDIEFWIDEVGNPLKVITPWGWKLVAE